MADIVTRVAMAICKANGDEWNHPVMDGHADYRIKARAAIEAMKYDDADEGVLIDVSNGKRIEIITLAEAWDDMIDGHLHG